MREEGGNRRGNDGRRSRRREGAIDAEDRAELSMIVRCKVNSIRTVFTNAHADEEESQGVEAMFAFQVETKAARDFFNGANRSAIDGEDELANGTKSGEVQSSGRARRERFKATTTKEGNIRVDQAKLGGKRNSGHDSLEHVFRKPAIRADLQSIQFAKEGSAMSRVDNLTTEETASRTAFFHGKVVLQFVDNNVMGITQATVIIFEKNNARGALDAKIGARVGTKGQVGRGASLALNDSMGARAEDATVGDVDDFVSPGLERRGTTVRARAKIQETDAMHEGETPMVAGKGRAIKEREGGVLASFDAGFSFAIAGGIVTTSAFDDAMLGSNSNTKLGAAPEFTTVVSAPGKSRNAVGLDKVLAKPDPEGDGWVFVATKENPGVGGDSFNDDEEGIETANGGHVEEAKIHVETGTFDVEDKAGTRAISNRLAFRAEADGTVEIGRNVNLEGQALNGALRDHAFENISAKTTETKMKQVEQSRALNSFG
jgi:hypothetical protein